MLAVGHQERGAVDRLAVGHGGAEDGGGIDDAEARVCEGAHDLWRVEGLLDDMIAWQGVVAAKPDGFDKPVLHFGEFRHGRKDRYLHAGNVPVVDQALNVLGPQFTGFVPLDQPQVGDAAQRDLFL